ncbi:MAG TPA: nitrate- and nitrite sensing domain-containing protein [Trebonia sp.]|nr:nitrate- and nitrite sensing domain-containing protein [Trebonia sp.]
MLAVPLLSLLALWGFAASITVSPAIRDASYTANTKATNAGAVPLFGALPQERAETYLYLLSGRRSGRPAMLAARQQVNAALPAAKAAFLGGQEASSSAVLNALITDLGQLDKIRGSVDSGATSPLAAFQAYSGIVDAEFHYFLSSVENRGDHSLDATSVGATDGGYALEMASREAAIIGGAFADGNRLTPAIREQFASAAAQRHALLAEAQALVTPAMYANFVDDSPAYRQFQAMETQILDSSGTTVPVNPATWNSTTQAYLLSTQKTQAANAATLSALSNAQTHSLVTEAVAAGGIGLAAVVVSLFVLLWFGRKVTKDLTGLNTSAREMAEERLPRLVGQLRRGENVDVHEESAHPQASSISEISTISASFATVQGAAVAAAVDQARLRKGVNQVFLNISMRNQSLLYRQLKMLDSMERKTSDPGALAELFRLDHLTTRMRRHAEGLIILSGSTPDRGRREPVPVVDVLRAAVAEVEDYVRVDVVSESRDLIVGSAVSDMIHLLAELVENAAVFSPPNTRIEVRADRVGTGLVAEIEDRGLGLSDADRDAVNRRLASPPEFDLANSDQLGLFIVSQLATRHRVMVSLRESAYGGTTAIVRLPFGVVVRDDDVTPVAEDGWVIPDGPAGPDPRVAALEHSRPADGSARAHSSRQPDGGAPSSFVGTGRHRLRTAPTGRIADAGGDPGRGEPENVPAPRTAPRAPWEMESRAPVPASPGGSHLGMPIRVPQASMAPQLRARDQTDWGQGGREETSVDDRAPEATRDMLAQMQQGWKRGRVDELDDPEDASPYGTDW